MTSWTFCSQGIGGREAPMKATKPWNNQRFIGMFDVVNTTKQDSGRYRCIVHSNRGVGVSNYGELTIKREFICIFYHLNVFLTTRSGIWPNDPQREAVKPGRSCVSVSRTACPSVSLHLQLRMLKHQDWCVFYANGFRSLCFDERVLRCKSRPWPRSCFQGDGVPRSPSAVIWYEFIGPFASKSWFVLSESPVMAFNISSALSLPLSLNWIYVPVVFTSQLHMIDRSNPACPAGELSITCSGSALRPDETPPLWCWCAAKNSVSNI